MPIASRLRPLAAACLAVAGLLATVAGPAFALEPPRPLPGYRAEFVTQTDERPWKDCLWSSAAMLLDKWTNGDVIRTHQQLRRLSGDAHGGSDFEDLHVAFAKLGFKVPDNRAGDRLSWGRLLSRLRRGAGAIILGDYGDLPAWYGRWDYGFWKGTPQTKAQAKALKTLRHHASKQAKAKARKKLRPDNHAVYVERYDRRHGRVWLMDPLGRGDWHGEWIPVSALKRFAWQANGSVFAVTTPVAAAAPFTGVRFSDPAIGLSTDALTATWRLSTPRGWRYPGADLPVSMRPAGDALDAAARSALVDPRVSVDPAPASPTSAVVNRTLRLTTALPGAPGVYKASMSLTDRRFGRPVIASREVAVFVPGDQRATLRVNVNDSLLTAGGTVKVNVSVANAGTTTWAEATGPDGDDAGTAVRTARERNARLVAHWIRLDDAMAAGSEGGPAPEDLREIPLAPGELARFRGELRVPEALGRWALVVDVEDAILGSYAALGSAPAVAVFEVVAARGIEAVD
jgi:hypothetical protein